MERRSSGLGVADVLDLAAVDPLAGVAQHDALLLLAGRLDVHACQTEGGKKGGGASELQAFVACVYGRCACCGSQCAFGSQYSVNVTVS